MAIYDNIAELKTMKLWMAVNAEFMGTMLLVLIACGSCQPAVATVLSIALSFGLTVGTVVWTIAHVSGGHINPAVTVAFLVTRKITLVRALLYILAQCGGAIAGAMTLKMASGAATPTLGTSSPNQHVPGEGVLLIELFITFLLVFVVFATCDGRRKGFNGSGPLTIGLSVTIGHLWAVPLTGAGTNPARVFGPALISGTWTSHWAYWVGPILGGIAAGIMYDLTFAVNANRAKLRAFFTRSDYDDSQFDEHGERDDSDHNDTALESLDHKHQSRK